MPLTRSNIENIRNHAKRRGLEPTAEQIREAAAECCTGDFDVASIPEIIEFLLNKQPANIVLSEPEKEDLIATSARQVGVSLVTTEVKLVAGKLRNGFDDQEQLLTEIMTALVAYVEHRTNKHSAIVEESASQIRSKLALSNQKITDAFTSVDDALEAVNSDLKSQLAEITEFLSITA